jgi:hypothetical protein
MSDGQMQGEPPAAARPFRRGVFFIAGFDPNGAKYLYWLFRREMGTDNALEGRTASVGRMSEAEEGLAAWQIETADGGTPVVVDYTVMSPRRVVLDRYYLRNVFALIWAYLFAIYSLVLSGGYRRVLRLPVRTLIMTHYIILGVPGFFWLGAELAYWPMLLLRASAGEWVWMIVRATGGLVFLQALILVEGVLWLYFFVSAARLASLQGRGRAEAFDRMVDGWIDFVANRQAEKSYDEVLIVGHSVGSIQAVEMAERLHKDAAFAGRLSLLTLGSADMVLSYQNHASRFRAAIAAVATAPNLVWIEYFSPTDAICRGGTDPVAAAEIDLGGRPQAGPAMRSLNLHEMFTPLSLSRLPLNLVKQHLLYLCSGDRRSSYSYFRLICQAKRLE